MMMWPYRLVEFVALNAHNDSYKAAVASSSETKELETNELLRMLTKPNMKFTRNHKPLAAGIIFLR